MAEEKSLDAAPKRTGDRKRRGASEAPRKVMAFRVSADTYDKILNSSQERGLSLTEEVERRLAFSFDMSDTPRNEFILRAMAQALRYTDAVMGIPWNKSHATALVCSDALKTTSDLVLRSYDYAMHPFDVLNVASTDTEGQAVAKRRAKMVEGVGEAGQSIGLQVVQAFLGKSIDEIRKIGADHIMAAKAFAEQWEDDTYGNAGKREAEHRARREGGLGNIAQELPADPDEGEGDTAPAPVEQPAPTPARRRRAAGTRA